MKVKNSKLIKLEDLQREDMYRDYLARLKRDRQAEGKRPALRKPDKGTVLLSAIEVW